MANYIQTPGPTTIFSNTIATTSLAGSWYTIHSKLRNLTFEVKQTTSSAGATASSTTYIEISNDGVTPLATKGQTIALIASTDAVADGGVLSSSMQGQWGYIRANVNSLTTSTAGSVGFPVVTVIVNAGTAGS